MTVQFSETDEAPAEAGSRPAWLLLASSACWAVASALLVLASTLDVWTFSTSWPTGNGVASGRVSIVYDAWGEATFENLSDFGAPIPPPVVSWAPLLISVAVILILCAGIRVLSGKHAFVRRVVLGVSLAGTGALISLAAAARSAQSTFRRPLDYAGISPGQTTASANGSMLAALTLAAIVTVAGTLLAVLSDWRRRPSGHEPAPFRRSS